MMMYGWKKAAAALGIWAVLTAVFPAVSIAAVKTETRTPITSVSLKVRSDVQADYELNEATVMPPRTAACIPSALINGLPRIIRITGTGG